MPLDVPNLRLRSVLRAFGLDSEFGLRTSGFGRAARIAGLLWLAGVALATEGYYKDVFMDGGTGLTHRTRLYAAESLGLSYEYLAREDTALLQYVMVANPDDANGCLLYPDGSPRFRLIYTNGGDAGTHGTAMGDTGRRRVRDFYSAGGSYSGSCAGAYLASLSNQDSGTSPFFYHLWPGRTKDTRMQNAYVGNFIPPDSPLLQYDSFGGDFYIDSLYVYNGPFANESIGWPPSTEVLLRYDTAGYFVHNKVSAWAYKAADSTGRCALLGTHPEGWGYGEQLHLTEAVFRYALDGLGPPRLKATLSAGVTRHMNQPTGGDPAFARVGDKQYHHFACDLVGTVPERGLSPKPGHDTKSHTIARDMTEIVGTVPDCGARSAGDCPPPTISGRVPSPARNLSVTIAANDSFHLNLFLARDTFAFRSTADYLDTTPGAHKTILVPDPGPGRWYVGVECATTVTTYGDSCFLYNDPLHVLNGVAYDITATWDTAGAIAEERQTPDARRRTSGATIVRNQLTILQPANCNLQTDLALLDAVGKRVMALRTGRNDVSCLPPGVYFVRGSSFTDKLILNR